MKKSEQQTDPHSEEKKKTEIKMIVLKINWPFFLYSSFLVFFFFFLIQFLFRDSTIELLVCSRVFMFLFEAHLLVISQIGDGCVRKTFSMTNIFLCYSEG